MNTVKWEKKEAERGSRLYNRRISNVFRVERLHLLYGRDFTCGRPSDLIRVGAVVVGAAETAAAIVVILYDLAVDTARIGGVVDGCVCGGMGNIYRTSAGFFFTFSLLPAAVAGAQNTDESSNDGANSTDDSSKDHSFI